MTTAIAELIKTARGHAQRLRWASCHDADDHGAEVTRAEARLWQQLADSAEQECAGLILPLPPD